MPLWDQIAVGSIFFTLPLGFSVLTVTFLDKILPKKAAINSEYARHLRGHLATLSVSELIDTAVNYAIAAKTSKARADHARTR